MFSSSTRALATLAIGCTIAGCGGSSMGDVPGVKHVISAQAQPLNSKKIQHVIVVVLENRSFDDIFAGDTALANVTDPPVDVAPGMMGNSKGTMVPLTATSLSASTFDEDHSHQGWLAQYDGGKADGFASTAYAYTPASEIQPYFDMASQFAISDRFFHGITAPTFPSHLEIGAATTFGIIANPSDETWGCDSAPGTTTGLYDPSTPGEVDATAGPFPCFDDLSIFDLLDRGSPQVSWRYYVAPEGNDVTGELNIPAYFRHLRYGPDWQSDIAQTDGEILTDLASGNLRQVSFVIPNDGSTDHAGDPSMGPTYVKNLVNAFGVSQYYDNTLMIVTWDDWGGWFDHVVPPKRPDGSQLSFRKPILFIGGYVKHDYASHVQTEDASIAKTLEEIFNLGTLGQHDVGANPFDDVVDVTQTPPPFAMITSNQGVSSVARRSSAAVERYTHHGTTDFRVIPGSFMRARTNGSIDTGSPNDYYGSRAADY